MNPLYQAALVCGFLAYRAQRRIEALQDRHHPFDHLHAVEYEFRHIQPQSITCNPFRIFED